MKILVKTSMVVGALFIFGSSQSAIAAVMDPVSPTTSNSNIIKAHGGGGGGHHGGGGGGGGHWHGGGGGGHWHGGGGGGHWHGGGGDWGWGVGGVGIGIYDASPYYAPSNNCYIDEFGVQVCNDDDD